MRWCSTKIVLTPFYRSSPEELIGQRVGQHYLEKKLTILKKICCRLEVTTMEIFNKFGWTSRSRIQA
jgi:hypothetical protein